MAILKSEIRNKYTTVPNSVIRAKDLSDAEYRLLMYLYSLPDGWKINQGYLGNELNCSRVNVNKKIRRVKELGYLEIIKSKDDTSTDYIYILKDKGVSIDNVSSSDVSLNDVSVSDTHINTNIINTELIKNDITTTTEGNNTIFGFIEENFGRTISSYEYSLLDNWLNDFKEEMIIEAFKISIKQSVKKFSYVEAILNDWKSNDIKTLKDIPKEKSKETKIQEPTKGFIPNEKITFPNGLVGYYDEKGNIHYEK